MRIHNVGIFFNKNTSCKEVFDKVKKIVNNDFKTFGVNNYDVKIIHSGEDEIFKIQTEVTIYEILFIDKNWQKRGKKYTQVYYDPSFQQEFIDLTIIPRCIGVRGDKEERIKEYVIKL